MSLSSEIYLAWNVIAIPLALLPAGWQRSSMVDLGMWMQRGKSLLFIPYRYYFYDTP